jgi:hypothetical protein
MRSPLPSSPKIRFALIFVVGVFSLAGTSCSSSSSRSTSDSTVASSEAPVEATIVAIETVADSIAETIANTADGAEDEYAIDGLPLGLSGDELQSKIGSAPTSKSDLTLEGASGEYVTSWKFEGVEAKLSATAQDLPVTLCALTITAPSALKPKVNTEESSPDKIVVGSVFGGMIFKIENGTVSEIFVGAAAE